MNDKKDFEAYMKKFKTEPLKEKQAIILEQLKLLSSFTNTLCEDMNIDNDILLNDELLDVNNEDYTEDDFAEAVIVYVNSIQNSICDYSNGINEMLDKTLDNMKQLEVEE